MIPGGDEDALWREARKLAGDEVAGVGPRALVFVEVSTYGDGIHIELERKIDDAPEGGPQLFASFGCLAGRHAEAGEGTVQVEVGEVQDTNHLGQTLDKCSSFVNRNFVERGSTTRDKSDRRDARALRSARPLLRFPHSHTMRP